MRSEGYIQFPDSLTPLSLSLFAGLAPSEVSIGDARGIVDISRSIPSPFGAVDGDDCGDVERSLEKRPLGGGGVWSICEESQLFPRFALLASIDAPGKVVVEERDLSQAVLVSASTGHVSAGVSELLDMLSLVSEAGNYWSNEDVELNDAASCMKSLEPCNI